MLSLKLVHGAEFAAEPVAEMRPTAGQARLTIGRDPACDWFIPDMTRSLSGRHCEIVFSAGSALLHDLSTNGTFLNGANTRMAADHALCDGDHFLLGPYLVAVSWASQGRRATVKHGQAPAAPPRPAPTPAPPPPVDPAAATAVANRPTFKPGSVPAHEAVRATELLQALARGLGLPAEQLAGRDPLEMAERVAALARVALDNFAAMNQQQSLLRQQLGSRERAAVRVDGAHALRLAASPEAALLALLRGPMAASPLALQQGFAQLQADHQRLASAIGPALQRLASDLEPAAIERAIDRKGQTTAQAMRNAALWQLYSHVWQTTGLNQSQPWARSFVEAGLTHLASAYDAAAANPARPAQLG